MDASSHGREEHAKGGHAQAAHHDPLASYTAGQHAHRHLGHEVAVEEGSQNVPLHRLLPHERPVLARDIVFVKHGVNNICTVFYAIQ